MIWALLLLAGTLIIPESPRWLVAKGRDDEALRVLSRLHDHADSQDDQNSFAHQELVVIRQQIAEDQKQLHEGGRWQIFTEKTYRKRLILACMTTVGSQNTGILVRFPTLCFVMTKIADSTRSSTTTMLSSISRLV
jgi:hypothetical protein